MNPQPLYRFPAGQDLQLGSPWRRLLTAAALMGTVAALNAWNPALPTAVAVTIGCLLLLAAALLTRLFSADLHWLRSSTAAALRRSASRRRVGPTEHDRFVGFLPREDWLWVASLVVLAVELMALLVYVIEASDWLSALANYLA